MGTSLHLGTHLLALAWVCLRDAEFSREAFAGSGSVFLSHPLLSEGSPTRLPWMGGLVESRARLLVLLGGLGRLVCSPLPPSCLSFPGGAPVNAGFCSLLAHSSLLEWKCGLFIMDY